MGASNSTLQNLRFMVVDQKIKAEQMLNQSEQEDRYLEECFDSPTNAKARQSLTYQPNTMSIYDYQTAVNYLESAKEHLPKRLRSDLQTVSIVQLMPSADDGMPHTRPGDVICFPDLSQLYSLTTLKHELWHIHQRRYQALWLDVFQAIGWKPWKGTLPQRLEENRRLNPDTIDHPLWVFHDTWIPFPVFRDIRRPKVSEVDIWFYHAFERYHVKTVPTELSFYFPGLPSIAYEHPREITAYMLAEPDKYKQGKGFQDLLQQIGHISL